MTTINLESHVNRVVFNEDEREAKNEIVNLESYVSKIAFVEEKEEYEPVVETVQLHSNIGAVTAEVSYKTNKKIEDRKLNTYLNTINTTVSTSESKTISITSGINSINTNVRTIEAQTNAQIRELSTNLNKLIVNHSITTYRYPMTYKAHISHMENRTNVYHIE